MFIAVPLRREAYGTGESKALRKTGSVPGALSRGSDVEAVLAVDEVI